MAESDIVSPSRIERLLDLACAYTVPLSVVTEARGEVCRYESRMLEMERDPDAKHLIIDLPITDGPAIALIPDTPITLHLAVGGKRFMFESAVMGKATHEFEGRRKAPALRITYPNVLKSGNQRAFYRVSVPEEGPISVEADIAFDIAGPPDRDNGATRSKPVGGITGTMLNLSVGGALLAVDSLEADIPVEGTDLDLRIVVAEDEAPLKLKGAVRRIEGEQAGENLRLGIEFIETDERFEYKLALNRLYKYIAERHRKLVQSRAKPHS
jgi:c-di-GMP-binding flagellar brake protein YcgR